MYLVPSFNRATVKPTRPADVETPGWFQLQTQVDFGTMNMLVDECRSVAILKGAALDRDNDHQMADALEGVVKAIEGRSAEASNVDTLWSMAVIASTDATVGEDDGGVVHCLVAASNNSAAKGYETAAIAARDSRAGTVGGATFTAMVAATHRMAAEGDDSAALASKCTDTNPAVASGDQSLIAACVYTDDTKGVTGQKSAAIASEDEHITGDESVALASNGGTVSGGGSMAAAGFQTTVSGDRAAALATFICEVTQTRSVIVASYQSKNKSNAHSVCLASRYCDSSTSTVPPEGSVFGGWDAGTTHVEPSWRLESNGGHVRGAGTVASGGLDYAEWYENTDGVAHPLSRLVTYGPEWDGCRLAQEGQEVLGVVSVHPSVLGGDDSFSWKDKWLRDEHGQLVYETSVVVEKVKVDPKAWAERTRRERRATRWPDHDVSTLTKELSMLRKTLEKEHDVLNRDLRQVRGLKRHNQFTKKRMSDIERQLSVFPGMSEKRIADVQGKLDAALKVRASVTIDVSDLDLTEVESKKTIKTRVLNPAFDPNRVHVPREERPDEHTKVGTMGQMLVDVTADVKPGDWVVPWKDGIGQPSKVPGLGRPVRCMKVTYPFNAAKGYGVAKCQVA